MQVKVTRHSDDLLITRIKEMDILKSCLTPGVAPAGFQATTHEPFWNS
jgi:hypothetical protein